MKIIKLTGLLIFLFSLILFTAALFFSSYNLSEADLSKSISKEYHLNAISNALNEDGTFIGKEYSSNIAFVGDLGQVLKKAQSDLEETAKSGLPEGVSEWDVRMSNYDIKQYKFYLAKNSSTGFLIDNLFLIFFLTFIAGIIGALMYILPEIKKPPGIKNNGIYHSALHSRGWIGIILGVYLILFYIFLYKFPEYITGWVLLADPISQMTKGTSASQWFMYGLLYTIAMLVMGVRMLIKYRHNRYQLIRTYSVIFFQVLFAFSLPEILARLNQPAPDIKNIWPLDYTFFFDYRLGEMVQSGTFGLWLLVWGIILFVVGVPLLTYFYGKRWYCSWVCGCGGLAETLGDPFRQQSDKSLKAWKIERYIIHGVLVFAVVMTVAVIYTYLSGKSNVLFLSSYQIRDWYGFGVGFIFAGVVGTGFYPLMGNRVWCRFGCPLAAYLGMVQKFKSRFRITVNGGQCISCGNCSTYCEMGIDVRAYAQRGQDIVRSSCVGCGICAAVCPRGVLRLENGTVDIDNRTMDLRTVMIEE